MLEVLSFYFKRDLNAFASMLFVFSFQIHVLSSLVGFQDLPNFNEPFNVKGGVLVCVIQMYLLGL